METFIWIITAIWLGAGLAMDACAASMSNGLSEPNMKRKKKFLNSGIIWILPNSYADIRLFNHYYIK